MCEFATMAMALSAIGGLVGGVQQYRQQQAQADYAVDQAALARRQTRWEIDRHFESDSAALADLAAQQAASGAALEGSKADFVAYAGFGQAVERERLGQRGAQQSSGLLADAAFRRGAATAALTGAAFGAGASLLDGLGSAARPAAAGAPAAAYSRPLVWTSDPGRRRGGAGGYLPGGV